MKKFEAQTDPRAAIIIGVVALLLSSCAARTETTKDSANVSAAARESIASQESKKTPPATDNQEKVVQARLVELFGLCKNDDADAAAGYFVYRGPDEKRKWKDVYRAADPLEKATVADACRRVKAYLEESEGYTFDGMQVQRESEGTWHALKVSFRQKKGGTKKAIFAFLPINGQFAIGDID